MKNTEVRRKLSLNDLKKYKLSNLKAVYGGNSEINGNVTINTEIKGGVLNAAIGKGR